MINVRQEARKNAQFIEAECLGGASACGTISCVILTEKGDNFRECVAAAVRQVRCGLMLLIASLEPWLPCLTDLPTMKLAAKSSAFLCATGYRRAAYFSA